MIAWLFAFALTQLIEVPILERALRGNVLAAFGASAFTHPIVWFACTRSGDLGTLAAAELFAWIAEALYLQMFGVKRPFLWSLLANGTSFGVGLFLV